MGVLQRVGAGNQKWLACLALGCVAIGVLTGAQPGYGLAAALGLAVTVAAVAEITVGLVLFTVLSFFEVVTTTGGAASLMKVVGLLLVVSWLARTVTSAQRVSASRSATPPIFLIAGVCLVAWSALSITWALSPGTAATSSYRYLLNLLLFPIVLAAVRRREHLLWIAAAFVFGAAISALYGFAVPVAASAGDAGRLAGSVGDPNDQAAVLVAAIPIALALAGVFKSSPGLRFLALLGAAISLAGVFNTLSRGGLIALGCVMLASVAFGGRWRRWAVLLLFIGVLGTATYYVAIAPASSRARVTSGDTSGRSDLWRVALRMIRAQPLSGVGSGNFQIAAVHYVSQPGAIHSAQLIVKVPHVAHDVYLQLLADLGIPGLLAFLTIVVASFGAAIAASVQARRSGDRDLELLAKCLALAVVGFMASDVFLSGEFSKQLWIVLALCPAVLVLARPPTALSRAPIRTAG